MSKAVKCDRCYQCFDPAGMLGYMVKFRNPSVYTAKDIRGGETSTCSPLMNDRAVDASIDLCPKCAKTFVEFLAPTGLVRKNNKPVSEKDGV